MYRTRAQIETQYGAAEVAKWADVDGELDSVAITARIAQAITDADAEIDGRLRGHRYVIPFATTPEIIAAISRKLAGVLLYEARGVQDWNVETGQPSHRLEYVRRWCYDALDDIASGKIRLDLETTRLTPEIVEFETSADTSEGLTAATDS